MNFCYWRDSELCHGLFCYKSLLCLCSSEFIFNTLKLFPLFMYMLCCKKKTSILSRFFFFISKTCTFLCSPHLHAVPLHVSCKLLSLFASTILFPLECIFAQLITKRYQALNKSELFSCVVLYQQICELELLM